MITIPNPLAIFDRKEAVVDLEPADLRPMSELEHFQSKTRSMIDGLDDQIERLDREISEAIARLNDLRRIRGAQQLALNYMEDKS